MWDSQCNSHMFNGCFALGAYFARRSLNSACSLCCYHHITVSPYHLHAMHRHRNLNNALFPGNNTRIRLLWNLCCKNNIQNNSVVCFVFVWILFAHIKRKTPTARRTSACWEEHLEVRVRMAGLSRKLSTRYFTIRNVFEIKFGSQIQQGEVAVQYVMGKTFILCGTFWSGEMKEKYYSEILVFDGRMILKCVLRK